MKLPRGVTVHGPSLRVTFTYRGVLCRESLGLPPTPPNVRHADRLLGAIQHEITFGTFDYAARFPEARGRTARLFGPPGDRDKTVGEALDEYLAAIRPSVEVSTWKDYASAVRHHLRPAFGDLRLADLTATQLRNWSAALPMSGKRVNNVLVPLRGTLKVALADGILARDLAAAMRNRPVRTRDPDPFDAAERERILEAMAGRPQGRNMIGFDFWTGLRTSELIEVQWADVDLKRNVLEISRARVRGVLKHPKTRSGRRTVELLPPAVDFLRAQREHTYVAGGHVFHADHTGEPWIDDGQVRKRLWVPALRASKVRYREAYQARHTFASMMLSAGEPILWVSRQLGHKNPDVTLRRYARWLPTESDRPGARAVAMFGRGATGGGLPF